MSAGAVLGRGGGKDFTCRMPLRVGRRTVKVTYIVITAAGRKALGPEG